MLIVISGSYWTEYHDIASNSLEFCKVFNPHKPSKDHWTTLSCGSSSYHINLLIDTQLGRIGVELNVPNDKAIGQKATDNISSFEKRLGLKAKPIEAKKTPGLRFYKDGCKIKDNQDAWPGYIKEQVDWALAMRKLIDELGL